MVQKTEIAGTVQKTEIAGTVQKTEKAGFQGGKSL